MSSRRMWPESGLKSLFKNSDKNSVIKKKKSCDKQKISFARKMQWKSIVIRDAPRKPKQTPCYKKKLFQLTEKNFLLVCVCVKDKNLKKIFRKRLVSRL